MLYTHTTLNGIITVIAVLTMCLFHAMTCFSQAGPTNTHSQIGAPARAAAQPWTKLEPQNWRDRQGCSTARQHKLSSKPGAPAGAAAKHRKQT